MEFCTEGQHYLIHKQGRSSSNIISYIYKDDQRPALTYYNIILIISKQHQRQHYFIYKQGRSASKIISYVNKDDHLPTLFKQGQRPALS